MDVIIAKKVLDILEEEVQKYQVPIMDLVETHDDDPFKILIGTILSSRTKDATTAKVCKQLFKEVTKPEDFEKKSVEEIEKLIYPCGFYKTKAKNLKKLPIVLTEQFGGKIPQTIEELVELPGVGRKTANLVVSLAFDKDGLCVDTHVHRITNRWGFIRTKTPLESEARLKKKLPKDKWRVVNRVLVAYGQQVCTPISPWCSKCPVEKYCEQKGVRSSR